MCLCKKGVEFSVTTLFKARGSEFECVLPDLAKRVSEPEDISLLVYYCK